jgi:hypothetical protein
LIVDGKIGEITPQMIGDLGPSKWASLKKAHISMIKGEEFASSKGSYKLYSEAIDDPSILLKVNMHDKYYGEMSNGMFKELVKLKASAKKPDAAEKSHLLTRTQKVANLVGLGAVGEDSKHAFNAAFDQKLQAYKVTHGKHADKDEMNKIADRMVLDGEVDGSGWLSDKKKLWQVKPGERFIPDMTTEEKALMINQIKLKNGEITDENINKAYLEYKGVR